MTPKVKRQLTYLIQFTQERSPWGPHSTEVAVIEMLSNNIQYEVVKPRTIIDDISGDKN